jgi:hypothetical protein
MSSPLILASVVGLLGCVWILRRYLDTSALSRVPQPVRMAALIPRFCASLKHLTSHCHFLNGSGVTTRPYMRPMLVKLTVAGSTALAQW